MFDGLILLPDIASNGIPNNSLALRTDVCSKLIAHSKTHVRLEHRCISVHKIQASLNAIYAHSKRNIISLAYKTHIIYTFVHSSLYMYGELILLGR